MQWAECSDAFHQDGSLRDLYVHNTAIEDWETFLAFLVSSSYSIEYHKDGAANTLPDNAASVFADREHAHNLSISVSASSVNCHFFISDEIELDLDPREGTSQEQLDAVLEFMSTVGAALGRDIVLTEENGPEHVWFQYAADADQLKYIEAS